MTKKEALKNLKKRGGAMNGKSFPVEYVDSLIKISEQVEPSNFMDTFKVLKQETKFKLASKLTLYRCFKLK